MLQSDDELDQSISVNELRSLAPKLMRELNFWQNQHFKRQRKKTQSNSFKTEKGKIITNLISNVVDMAKKPSSQPSSRQLGKQRMHKKTFVQQDINGNKILGNFAGQGLTGKTEAIFVNGAKFNGKFLNGHMLQGRFEFANGCIYEGGFMHNKFFGQGTLQFPDGRTVTGDWNAQKIVGNGQIKYASGEIYYGEIDGFKKNGFGYFFMKDGAKFIGHFKDGKIKGKGSYFVEDQLMGEGNWEDGELVDVLPIELMGYFTTFMSQVKETGTNIFQPQKVYNKEFTQYSLNSKQGVGPAKVFKSIKQIRSFRAIQEDPENCKQFSPPTFLEQLLKIK